MQRVGASEHKVDEMLSTLVTHQGIDARTLKMQQGIVNISKFCYSAIILRYTDAEDDWNCSHGPNNRKLGKKR